jgi:hypothetical protein
MRRLVSGLDGMQSEHSNVLRQLDTHPASTSFYSQVKGPFEKSGSKRMVHEIQEIKGEWSILSFSKIVQQFRAGLHRMGEGRHFGLFFYEALLNTLFGVIEWLASVEGQTEDEQMLVRCHELHNHLREL